MDKHRKTIRVIYWIVLLAGSAALGVCIAAFDLKGAALWLPSLGWLLLMVAAILVIDLLWYRELGKKMMALAPILREEQDPDRYIREVNALLEQRRSPMLQQVRLINISAAYCFKEDHAQAKKLLKQIEPQKLAGVNRAIYWADLALTLFFLGENEEACAIMEQQRGIFAQLKNHPQLGALLAELDIFRQLALGEPGEAWQLLIRARKRWPDDYNKRDFDHLEKLCREL